MISKDLLRQPSNPKFHEIALFNRLLKYLFSLDIGSNKQLLKTSIEEVVPQSELANQQRQKKEAHKVQNLCAKDDEYGGDEANCLEITNAMQCPVYKVSGMKIQHR